MRTGKPLTLCSAYNVLEIETIPFTLPEEDRETVAVVSTLEVGSWTW